MCMYVCTMYYVLAGLLCGWNMTESRRDFERERQSKVSGEGFLASRCFAC